MSSELHDYSPSTLPTGNFITVCLEGLMLGIWGNSTLNSLPVLQARLPDTLRFWEVDILYTVGAGAEKNIKGGTGQQGTATFSNL